MAQPELIRGLHLTFEVMGLDDDTISTLDPYRWGSHQLRLFLWIIRGHLKVVTPQDAEGQLDKFTRPQSLDPISNSMRHLEWSRTNQFERELKELGIEVVSYPEKLK